MLIECYGCKDNFIYLVGKGIELVIRIKSRLLRIKSRELNHLKLRK